ncbi:uncharacterized protein CANTADRAFT_29470, partial [Suhomyces tanzawaensis NRRL Y-17324]
KITKSRNGCLTCKRKRLKCDETKPVCLNCTRKKIECGGYATNFKWMSYENEEGPDPEITSKPSDKSQLQNDTFQKHLELASLSMTGKTLDDIKIENDLISKGLNPRSHRKHKLSDPKSTLPMKRARSLSQESLLTEKVLAQSLQRSLSSNSCVPSELKLIKSEFAKTNHNLDSLAEAAIDEIESSGSGSLSKSHSPLHQVPFSPNFSEFLVKHNSELTTTSKYPEPNDVNLTPPRTPKIRLLSGTNSPVDSINTPLTMIFDNDSARSLLRTSDQEQILHLYSLYTCTIMSIKNGANENPWRNMIIPLATKYSCLFNSIASMTLFHMAGNNELSNTRSYLRAKGYTYMKRCIVELATGLSRTNDDEISQELPADIALATCLNLAVGESWDTHISSGIAHLKGAKSMIQKVLNLLREQQAFLSKKRKELNSSPTASDSDYTEMIDNKKKDLQKKLILLDNLEWDRMVQESDDSESADELRYKDKSHAVAIPKSLQFLFNIWIYFEVLAQMTTDNNNDDKGIDLVATITSMLQNSRNKEKQSRRIRLVYSETGNRDSRSGFNLFDNLDTFNYNNEYVDPLLGCAQSLFLLMGKVATLIAKIRKKGSDKTRNSLTIITVAAELKHQLIEWKPTITPTMLKQANSGGMCDDSSSGNTWDISSCITTAEAYRFATLLYLHQAVPEIPSLSSHQLAEKIFILLAAIPTTSHLYVVHIFPLLVGSCEAEPGEEREWCEARWAHLSQRMWIGNIDRAFEVVKEVWRRKDEYLHRKRRSMDASDLKVNVSNDEQDGKLRNISAQISGLMAAVHSNQNSSVEDILGGISSPLHWNTVMKEWGWEVLLG